ncbi:lactate dehydrogenase [Lacticaseibacillus absianus]|uniref:lactate dehydrogenase n=1 Tax=Lacticaseibacillus absianus TaxID=2729623 RepID=UPI0015C9BB6D|nr:lactate dehydrogenase [Lacticaseibacillus absianus]
MQRVVVCGQSRATACVAATLIQSDLALALAVETPEPGAVALPALEALATLGANQIQKATPKVLGMADVLVFTDYSDAPAAAQRASTVAQMRKVLNTAMAAGFGGVVLVATQESAVGTFFAQRISGLPKTSVLGVGTQALTACFRRFLATRLAVPVDTVTAYAVGTQRDYALLWSRAYVGATPVLSLLKDGDPAALMGDAVQACQAFADAADEFVIAASVRRLIAALAGDALLTPVATLVDAAETPLALSQPMLIDARGVTQVARVSGSDAEQQEVAAITAGVMAKLTEIQQESDEG